MASNRPGFWGTALAGVISTIAAAVITWLFGYWPPVWRGLSGVLEALWGLVAYPVPLPAGLLACVAFLIAWLVLRAAVTRAAPVASDNAAPPLGQALPSLTPNELTIVQLLIRADGQWLGIEHISRGIHMSRLITERALEQLFARGYLFDNHNSLSGPSFRLSSAGRDYALDEGIG